MGQEVDPQVFTREDRTAFRAKIRQSLDVFSRMLRDATFDAARPMTGVEIELNLIDDEGMPALRNEVVLEAIADDDFQTELGQFNIEINIDPRALDGEGLSRYEKTIRDDLNHADASARSVGVNLLMIGILPTLKAGHMTASTISANPRYALLSEQVLAARGEDIAINISGAERLSTTSESIMPEAACTSVQLHLQVSPSEFAAYWNASQTIASTQLAIGANSPFLMGKQLWHETRIPLFEQATDTRSDELKAQGVRPRVWFGERWITSIFDLFEENVRYFPALLPVLEDEDPEVVLAAGDTPSLAELRLHNGTIYRWNRPIYDVVGDRPHVRVENRVLPAGPTVIDTVANAAYYFGLVKALVDADRPLWTQMSFSAAEENFTAAAKDGIGASIYWPGIGTVGVSELVLRKLLPMAADGLHSLGVDSTDRDKYLGIIEQRCLTGRNGATWQIDRFRALYEHAGTDRAEALRAMTLDYRERMHSNEPVHTWD
ncbi:glutamate--cysteine ligase [Mumia sp. Pv 4-285]|uniref:glutamate--cysteine ligase n=1 Tax=Mumia qirimensis TaxID=3234852 RepID=UPI00351D6E55